MKVPFLLIGLFLSSIVFAQTGSIRGTVIDDATGEGLFGVTAVIKGTTTGSVTDFDGKFEIKIAPGTYDLQVSFISYETLTISGVVVEEGQVAIFNPLRMREAVTELEEIVVTAEVIRQSEAALLTIKRKSANVLDGISSESFRKIGDSNAGEAAKRVTGVSVEGGKYVYVRGLGDRYTKTTLNSLEIPGLDPDRNSIQIDVFPTNLIDNMVVFKSFSAELPADFTGGIVNIETKDFPDEKIVSASVSVSYNPEMHFNGDYLDYDGSGTDFLGFDSGTRDLPSGSREQRTPEPVRNSDQEVNDFVNEFDPTLGPSNETSFTDYSLGFTLADQKQLSNGNSLGYLFSGNYSNSTKLYDNIAYGEFQVDSDPDQFDLVTAAFQDGVVSENNVLLGGLAGVAYKTQSSKYKFNVTHLQNGESRSARFSILDNDEAVGRSGFTASSSNLEYSQRGVTNFFLNGEHHFQEATWKVDWRGSFTLSSQEDPDIRRTAFTLERGETVLNPGAGGLPSRLWRDLEETNAVGKVDVTREYQFLGDGAKLKFGVSHVNKERDYEIIDFGVLFFGGQPEWSGDPNEIFADENIFPNGNLWVARSSTIPNPNEYNSVVNNTGIYVSNEFSLTSNLKSILGIRGENFVQRHTGRDQDMINILDDEKVLDSFDFFPSANFIYALNERQNLRVSYSRTIARPSFKELSFAQILDPVSNRIFNGGLFPIGDWDGNLTETRINNFDIRWELFQERGQLLSFSAFYKTFDDPIELVRIPEAQSNNEFQPRNVGDGQVYGVEIEFRQSLGLFSSVLENFSLTGNLTLVESIIDISPTELRARENFQKTDEDIDETRGMAGQAPWIINAGLAYNDPVIGLDAGFFYNVKGETLTVVGGGLFPDVFSEPFHSLNFNLNKSLGEEERVTVNFSVSNILNDDREEFYQNFRAEEQVFQRFSPGTAIGVGAKYNF